MALRTPWTHPLGLFLALVSILVALVEATASPPSPARAALLVALGLLAYLAVVLVAWRLPLDASSRNLRKPVDTGEGDQPAVLPARLDVQAVSGEALSTAEEVREQSAAELDLDQFYQSDLDFHRKLWDLSGNTYLADVLERMVVPLFAFFVMKTRRKKESYIASAVMHGKIVEALATRSAAELRELMRDSLKGWTDDMLDLLFSEPDEIHDHQPRVK